jgi:1A family penicillin-binding protein
MSQLRLRLAGFTSRAARRVRHHPRLVAWALGLGGISLVALVLAGRSYLLSGLPDEAAIQRLGDMDQATVIYDVHDQLAFTLFRQQRIEVPLSKISPDLIRAIIAIEDQRFYDHHGFDLVRIAAAVMADVRHRRAAQGASTITQQLARQSFLTADKTIHRKLQELVLATRIERRYTKQEILGLYLNKVYFGDGLYGVESASRGYFGKTVAEISLAEAALLAGLVKSPSPSAPTVNLERAQTRRNLVLQVMFDSGAITRDAWQAARAERVVLRNGLHADEPRGEYFKEQVRRELGERFGWQRVYESGLRVFSTIDMGMQQSADAAVAQQLKALDARRSRLAASRAKRDTTGEDNSLQAALVAMDPVSGHVRAMVGGRDFGESSFNRAVQARRQPGSAFKPFVYAAALEAGYTPATVIDDLSAPVETLEGNWMPEDEHSDADSMSLRTGLRTSSNRAAVRLLQEVGLEQTVQYAKNLGIGDVPSVPSLALGSGEVTLQSLTAAYAAFANGGMVPQPVLIRRVEDLSGQVLYESTSTSTRAISEVTAFLMASMLADVVDAGTGARARAAGFTLPAAGKTGTTNDFNDAWFVGFTPRLVTGVWVGFDQPHTILPNGFASEIAVPMWAAFMKAATTGDKAAWLPRPAGVVTATVCRLSGKLATKGCEKADVASDAAKGRHQPMVYAEFFARGTEPTTSCLLHGTRGFFGALASIFGGDRQDHARAEVSQPDPPPANLPSAPIVAQPKDPSEPAPSKRGFWSRVFGRGHDKSRGAQDQ